MDAILEYFSRIAVYNPLIVAIELFLIGIVVYWAVNFLEGTRGERLFRGVIIVLLAGSMMLKLLIVRFDFVRLQYLYGYFLISVLIIAVAGFQPELRRMLIRIGQAGTFKRGSHQQLSQVVEEIVEAIVNLSAKNVGAIIVIEQQVALGEFIETGVRLDARVRSALLETIFYPGTPLHDLAVLIRGQKIIAARIQLPLAEIGSMGGALGSRHRAAMGITRGSDAVALVVSEETGIVSIAREGKLQRHIDEAKLRDELIEIFVDSGKIAGKLFGHTKPMPKPKEQKLKKV